MERDRGTRLRYYLPLILWIGVIFFLSSGQGSSTRTSIIIRPLLEWLFPSAPEATIVFYHGIIRKLAHLTEYAVLALLACRAFARVSTGSLQKYFWMAAIVLVLIVASADEFNQSFNPDRTSSPIDVMIDVIGGVISTTIYMLATRSRRKGASS